MKHGVTSMMLSREQSIGLDGLEVPTRDCSVLMITPRNIPLVGILTDDPQMISCKLHLVNHNEEHCTSKFGLPLHSSFLNSSVYVFYTFHHLHYPTPYITLQWSFSPTLRYTSSPCTILHPTLPYNGVSHLPYGRLSHPAPSYTQHYLPLDFIGLRHPTPYITHSRHHHPTLHFITVHNATACNIRTLDIIVPHQSSWPNMTQQPIRNLPLDFISLRYPTPYMNIQ